MVNNYYGDDIIAATQGMTPDQIVAFTQQYNVDPGIYDYIASHTGEEQTRQVEAGPDDKGNMTYKPEYYQTGVDPRWGQVIDNLGWQSRSQAAREYNESKGYMPGDSGVRDEFDYGSGYNMNADQEEKKAHKKGWIGHQVGQKLGDMAPTLIKAAAIGGLGYGALGAMGAVGGAGGIPAGVSGTSGAMGMGSDAASLAAMSGGYSGGYAIPTAFAGGGVASGVGTAAGGDMVGLGMTGAGGGLIGEAGAMAAGDIGSLSTAGGVPSMQNVGKLGKLAGKAFSGSRPTFSQMPQSLGSIAPQGGMGQGQGYNNSEVIPFNRYSVNVY